MRRVLLTDEIREAGVRALEREAEVVRAPDPNPETIASMIADFDGMVSRNTFIGEEIFSRAPRLKVVATHGAGTDHVDISAATEHGVYVVNTPGANAQSVAEVALGFMIALSHRIAEGDSALRTKGDYYARNSLIGRDLNKKTVGIFGLGNVGRKLAKICSAGFDMRVLGYDPFVDREDMAAIGVRKIDSIDDVLSEADYVSLNCPYVDELYHMIDAERLRKMKPTAYLINCARGQLVDENALYEALRDNTIAGAAVDVYEKEPPDTAGPIYRLSNFIATPHIATNAEDSIDNMSLISAVDILHVLNGEPRKAHVVNKELLKH